MKKDAIDELLEEFDAPEEKKEVVKKGITDIDVSDKEELAEELIVLTREDREMADKLFNLFYPEISRGQDRSQASKEALSKALELKINAGRNIIDLMKIMKQEEKTNNSIGVFFSGKKTGINLQDIKDNYQDSNKVEELEDEDDFIE